MWKRRVICLGVSRWNILLCGPTRSLTVPQYADTRDAYHPATIRASIRLGCTSSSRSICIVSTACISQDEACLPSFFFFFA
jgi:hypothetical protein